MANVTTSYETLNLEILRKLNPHTLPPYFKYQNGMGGGCFGDPPGFPTYFTREVYTSYGNSPQTGAERVIQDPETGVHYVVSRVEWQDGETWEKRTARQDALTLRLWSRLPIDHPRTIAWIENTYRHFRHCYVNDDLPANDSDHTLIYPVPSHKLRSFVDDPRFSDEWRTAEKRAIDAHNGEVESFARRIATPENHQAYRIIKRWYPQHTPDLARIHSTDNALTQTWWETLAERPTPETCPGETRWGTGHAHPMNGTWCQVCGYAAATN